jgi:hypothetical protein
MTIHRLLVASLAALIAAPLVAQTDVPGGGTRPDADTIGTVERSDSRLRTHTIQNYVPQDQRGINRFEPPKDDGTPFTGFALEFGAAFTQQFQGLEHSNAAAPAMTTVNGQPVNTNQLMAIGSGFNNAVANLYLNAQLAPGIRVSMTTYLSSRHHRETWVKDGFLLVDQSPIRNDVLDGIMEYVTLRAGHFEINYGDAHFRRTDNGQAMMNPFVGNYIMDAFTTEIGSELYFRTGPFLAMGGLTTGEIRGTVTGPTQRGRAYLGKLGFDQQLNPDLRVRLTGSVYTTSKAMSNTLYGGDRAGSRYYFVMENTQSTDNNQFTSGLINPGFANEVTAFQVNPFVKFRGLELFGVIEQAEGRRAAEADTRSFNQLAMDALYRFYGDRLYVGGRYNTVEGMLARNVGGTWQDYPSEISVDRWQLGGGWFVTPNILLKGEFVDQRYNDFPTNDIRHGGRFNGFMVEGVVAF